jgi:hypothetical protein
VRPCLCIRGSWRKSRLSTLVSETPAGVVQVSRCKAPRGQGLPDDQSKLLRRSDRNTINLDEDIFGKSGDFHGCSCSLVLAKDRSVDGVHSCEIVHRLEEHLDEWN